MTENPQIVLRINLPSFDLVQRITNINLKKERKASLTLINLNKLS